MKLFKSLNILIILGFLLSGCAISQEDIDNLLAGAQNALASPSASSVNSPASVAIDPQQVAELSDAELLEAVVTHVQSILSHLEEVSLSGVEGERSERLPEMIERLTALVERFETDEAFQGEVIARIRAGDYPPFFGGYERPTIQYFKQIPPKNQSQKLLADHWISNFA